jgi:hypothetical protein
MANPQIESLAYDANKVVLASACKPRKVLIPPQNLTLYSTGPALPAPDTYNNFAELPRDGNNVAVLESKGLTNLALRAWLQTIGAGLTAGVENSIVRIWGAAPMAPIVFGNVGARENIYRFSGQYFGEFTFTTNTLLPVPNVLMSVGVSIPTDSSWCDVITPTGGNPHTGFDTTLGSNGAGRWLRLRDTLGYPILIAHWLHSDADLQMNAEWYPY